MPSDAVCRAQGSGSAHVARAAGDRGGLPLVACGMRCNQMLAVRRTQVCPSKWRPKVSTRGFTRSGFVAFCLVSLVRTTRLPLAEVGSATHIVLTPLSSLCRSLRIGLVLWDSVGIVLTGPWYDRNRSFVETPVPNPEG